MAGTIREAAAEINGWSEYRREVLKSLTDLDTDIRELSGKVDGNHNYLVKQLARDKEELQQKIYNFQIKVTEELTALKTKASTWGSIWGAVTAAVITIIISAIFQTVLHK